MKKVYFQPEIELLTISALEDFLIASPGDDERYDGGDANDSWIGGGVSGDDGLTGNEWE